MKRINGDMRLSPTDLSNFLSCRHRNVLELSSAHGLLKKPVRSDPLFESIKERIRTDRFLEKSVGGRKLEYVAMTTGKEVGQIGGREAHFAVSTLHTEVASTKKSHATKTRTLKAYEPPNCLVSGGWAISCDSFCQGQEPGAFWLQG